MARLLVVGDERDLQKGLTDHLRQAGHQVSSGFSGEMKLEREGAPDLVLLVVKPFEVSELLRMQAILRGDEAEAPIRFGQLYVDRGAHRVWVGEDEISLTTLELRLLCTLFDRRPRVQSRERLLDDVWRDADVGLRTVDTSVRRLREKLQAASRYICTVHGAGYRFVDTPAADTKL